MSAPTGIAVSHELSSAFSDAVGASNVRFLKVSIRNESLVPDCSVPVSGTLQEDLDKLGDILEDNVPTYVLVRLDEPPTEWLAVYYVPDSAKVRDKMLYAATRATLTKTLGSAHFTDSIFATSKNDLTADAYAKHKLHLAAPQPMSAREKEMAEVKAAEHEAGGAASRVNDSGTRVGLKWAEDVENAVKELGSGESSGLVLISIDALTETLVLSSVSDVNVEGLGSALPASEPSYAFFAWPHNITSPPRREIVFIYCCPSSSPVKYRMLYSSGSRSVFQSAKEILESTGSDSVLASRKVETSDPTELNASYLATDLGLNKATQTATLPDGARGFARPKGPGRKR